MANEITIQALLSVNNPNASAAAPLQQSMRWTGQISQTTPEAHPDVWHVPTTAGGTAMPVGAVAAASQGYAMFENGDPNNYVQLGLVVTGTFYPFARVYPGKPCGPISLEPGVTIYGLANLAAVDLQMLLLQL